MADVPPKSLASWQQSALIVVGTIEQVRVESERLEIEQGFMSRWLSTKCKGNIFGASDRIQVLSRQVPSQRDGVPVDQWAGSHSSNWHEGSRLVG